MEPLVKSNGINKKFTSTGKHSGFKVDLHHTGLNEYKHLHAPDYDALMGKIHNQNAAWKEKWEKHLLQDAWHKSEKTADRQTQAALKKIQDIENILEHTLSVNDAINWETLKQKEAFIDRAASYPGYINTDKKNGCPKSVEYLETLPEPQKADFFKTIGWLDKALGRSSKIQKRQQESYDLMCKAVALENTIRSTQNAARENDFKKIKEAWEAKRIEHEELMSAFNREIDGQYELYASKDNDAVAEYNEMVLNNSQYSDLLPRDFDLQYSNDNGLLIVDYRLPALTDMPNISGYRYIKSKGATEEKRLSQQNIAKLYDSAIYQIALRTLHELYEADSVNALQTISFNGYVIDTNPSTGHEEKTCIISVQATKDVFQEINLKGIVSSKSFKECFKSLKGIGSSKLSAMVAIKPILELDKTDKRFRAHYDVAHRLDDALNIAAMPWEDFEHLVREIFEREFSSNGGEVKITQASADGGVDAIAFDPDPIRGGKIVIQAKRYTNTVGVSAVRDLYGTVMSEGATKGILVTTAEYGPDSYEFAKGKPISLLNGSNLLHLLQKHGHNAKIDIKEAKAILRNTGH